MLIEDSQVVRLLERIVAKLTSNPALREDLRQEAMIHLWQVQEQNPGQKQNWYLQNCRFHLLHYLALGSSVDSPKRRSAQVYPNESEEDSDAWMDRFITADHVREDVSARDIITSLSSLLSTREVQILCWCTEGFGNREIAKRLDISHPTVMKHRRRIASSAARLFIQC